MAINGEQKAILDAVGGGLRQVLNRMEERLQSFTPGAQHVSIPAPVVRNDVHPTPINVTNEVAVPQVTVQVDMAPVASAIDRMSAVMAHFAGVQDDTNEMLRQLLVTLADQPRPIFKPVLHMEAPQVTVESPQFTMEPINRLKRSLTIRHDDGTTSTIQED